MKTRTLFKISEDEKGNIKMTCPNREDAVMAMTDHILATASKGDQSALDVLFSVTVHFLASETSGRLEEQYIENLRKCIPPYRNGYAEMAKEMKKAMKNLS